MVPQPAFLRAMAHDPRRNPPEPACWFTFDEEWEGWQCILCQKYATEDHLRSAKHKARVDKWTQYVEQKDIPGMAGYLEALNRGEAPMWMPAPGEAPLEEPPLHQVPREDMQRLQVVPTSALEDYMRRKRQNVSWPASRAVRWKGSAGCVQNAAGCVQDEPTGPDDLHQIVSELSRRVNDLANTVRVLTMRCDMHLPS